MNIQNLLERLIPIIQYRVGRTLRSLFPSAPPDRLRQEVEDMVQEVVVHLVVDGRLDAWDPSRGLSLESFVDMVARRRTLDRYGPRKNRPSESLPEHWDGRSDDVDPESRAVGKDLLKRLLEALEQELSGKLWDTFRAVVIEECSTEDACRLLGVGRDVLYTRVKRIRGQARRLLRDLENEDGAPADGIVLDSKIPKISSGGDVSAKFLLWHQKDKLSS